MLFSLYLLIGYFFAAGAFCGPLFFREQLASTRWAAYSIFNAKYAWTMLFVALVVWVLWLPLVMFVIFAATWVLIFGALKTRIHFKSDAEVAAEKEPLVG